MTLDEFVESHGGKVVIGNHGDSWHATPIGVHWLGSGYGYSEEKAKADLLKKMAGTRIRVSIPVPKDLTL